MAEEEPVVAHPGCVVDATQDLDVERVGDVAGYDPQQRARAAAQAPGEQIRLVTQFGGDGANVKR